MALPAFVPTNPQYFSLSNIHSQKSFSPISFKFNTKAKSHEFRACLAKQEQARPLANFPSTIWKDTDIFTPKIDHKIHEFEENYGKQKEEMQHKFKDMLIDPEIDLVGKIKFIDLLCRLGVSYHFKDEIEEQLTCLFEALPGAEVDNDYDLHTTSLLFRVFRHHGYNMSCGYFNKFVDKDGKFKESLRNDAKGMLSLYEAAHLRHHNEDILEEALIFSKDNLEILAKNSNPHMIKNILEAFKMPFHKSVPRLAAIRYISLYAEEESKDESLLLFAKLDFNQVQLLHQKELHHLLSWWRHLRSSKLGYIRDRVVEAYLCTITWFFEPCYSLGRIISAKLTILSSVMDDTFDSYASFEEILLFNDAIQRWDIGAAEELPDYMKIIFTEFFNLFDEISDDLTGKGKLSKVAYVKDKVKELALGYLVEAEWLNRNYVPSFDEFMENGIITAGIIELTSTAYLGMDEEICGMRELNWFESRPRILESISWFARLADDAVSSLLEKNREHIWLNSVEIYMNENGWSREETTKKLLDFYLSVK